MAENKNQARAGGPGHGPGRGHGYQRPQNLRGTVGKLLAYIGRYKAALVVVAVCLVLSSVGSVASSYFLKPAINDYILPVIEETPPPSTKGKYIRIKYAMQLPTPTPQFAFFVNLPQYIKEPYRRFLENKIREQWDFSGVPMQLYFRAK